jgi:(S)-2-hydroxyglutarate dehydrogenase
VPECEDGFNGGCAGTPFTLSERSESNGCPDAKPPAVRDVAIIGGGIVGLATGLALAASGRIRPVVLDKEATPGAQQTGHNSGVIHSGLYYRPGSLKAQLCVRGRKLLLELCERNRVPHEVCGKVVVATTDAEVAALDGLLERGRANGLEGVQRLDAEGIRRQEPHVVGKAGLWVPQTGIVDYGAVARAMAGELEARGGEVRLNAPVRAVVPDGNEFVVRAGADELRVPLLVNCAGLHSDRVARLCGVMPSVRIVPFRGEYYELKPEARGLIRNLVYPVPDPSFPFLGVHFTRMKKGGVEAGPNAVLSLKREAWEHGGFELEDAEDTLTWPGFWKLALKHWKAGLGEQWRSMSKAAFVKALQKLVPELKERDLEPAGAGTRAQALDRNGKLLDDFHFEEAPGMVHVLNAPSPAATASLAIGEVVAAKVLASRGS